MYNQLNVLIENMFHLLERCPRVTGYVYIGQLDSCFKLHLPNSSLKYPDYNRICTDEGGELMKIDSDEKQQFAAKFLGLYFFVLSKIFFSYAFLANTVQCVTFTTYDW